MKILHTADWHIGQFKGPVVDGVNLRSQDTIKCLEYMVEVAQKEKPDIVCISGDIFHQEQIGPVRYSDEMIHATNIITALAHFASYVIVMRGTPNHDGSGQFRVLKRMLLNVNNVCVVTEGNTGCSDQRIWQDNSSICFQERRREGKSFSCRYPCTVRDQGNSGRNTAWNALY